MNVRKIAASLPHSQYESLERTRRRLRLGRSEAIQKALELWLAAQQEDVRVAEYIRGYLEKPDDAREGGALAKAWARGLEKEDW